MSTCTLWPVTHNETAALDDLAFQRFADKRSLRSNDRVGASHISFHDHAIHYAKSCAGSLNIYHGTYGEYLTFFFDEEGDLAAKLSTAINAVLAEHHAVRTQQEAAE